MSGNCWQSAIRPAARSAWKSRCTVARSHPGAAIDVRYRLLGSQDWSPDRHCSLGRSDSAAWHPTRYQLSHRTIRLNDTRWHPCCRLEMVVAGVAIFVRRGDRACATFRRKPQACDRVTTRVGFRTMQVDGSRLLLNGEPLSVRGMLNWGYAPPRLTPSLTTSISVPSCSWPDRLAST